MKSIFSNKTAFSACILVLMATGFSACSQSKYAYQQAYVYSQAIFPGNIRVNKDGRQGLPNIDTTVFVYIETKANTTPPWDVAWQKGVAYAITLVPVTADSVVIGRLETNRQQVVIKPQAGNAVWRVQINGQFGESASPAQPVQDSTGYIVLGEKITGKKIYLPLANAIRLEPQRRP